MAKKTTKTTAASALKMDAAVKRAPKAAVVELDLPRAGSLLAQAVARLSRKNGNGVTPRDLQDALGMSRRFSVWDMNNIAQRCGKQVVTGENRKGERTFRLV